MDERDNLQVKSYAVRSLDVAVIEHYAKEQGYPSASSALRRIIDEWMIFKQAQLPLPAPVACAQED